MVAEHQHDLCVWNECLIIIKTFEINSVENNSFYLILAEKNIFINIYTTYFLPQQKILEN